MTEHPNLIPRVPTEFEFAYLRTLIVDVVTGRVFRQDGSEYCTIIKQHNRVFVPFYNKELKRSKLWPRYHIIWWKATGKWPEREIDHENRISWDDRIDNIRLSTRKEQLANASKERRPKWRQ